ncbi:MAG: hypothetical protein ACU0DK_01730 [Pseudooceanicola sp.]
MDWLSDHSGALNVVINLGMLMVWIGYLQLFLITYLRARRPRLIITRGSGNDTDALCLVSNMSEEPVYVQTVYCTLRLGEDEISATITDRDILNRSDKADLPEGATHHGPLNRGDFMTIGPFHHMIDMTAERNGKTRDEVERLRQEVEEFEIMVVCAFGGDDLEIAAKRAFRLDASVAPWAVIPRAPQTQQVSSRTERKQIRRMVERELQAW